MEKGNSLAVPVAIVIAGVIIAGSVYISNSKKNGVNNQVAQVAQQNMTVAVADITMNPVSAKDYIRGNPNAGVVIVEYSDTECPFCKRYHGTMKAISDKLSKDGKVAWVYRNFPIDSLHANARKESEALLCAGKVGGQTGFWNYTDRIYAVTNSNDSLAPERLPEIAKDVNLDVAKFNECLNSGEMATLVNLDYEDAVKSGGTGTPYSIFVANKAYNKDKVQKFLLDNILKTGYPAELFTMSNDSKRVAVSGSMPQQFMEELVAVMTTN